VHSVRRHQMCERRLVTLHFQGESLTMTTAHPLMLRQSCSQGKGFQPILAAEVRSGNHLRTHLSYMTVTDVEHEMFDTEVVEIQLTDVHGTFFVRDASRSAGTFVEVCGALAPLQSTAVSILHFMRHDRFNLLFKNPMLAACREELGRAGWSANLGDLGESCIGPGKLFVRPDLASRAIMALRLRGRTEPPLSLSDVVVSEEFKSLVLEAVQQQAPRANPVKYVEVLDLGPAVGIRNTFIEVQEGSALSSQTAHSSTDAHLGQGKNPRKRKARDI